MKKGHIYFIAKFFEKRLYAEQFIKGQLYLNPATFFVDLESRGDGRADPNEGIHLNGLGVNTILKIDNVILNRQNGLIRSTVRRNRDLGHHIFCMYAADPKDRGFFHDENAPAITNPRQLELLRQAVLPDPKIYDMGPWCVLITDPKAFFARLMLVAKLKNLSIRGQQVEYYDPTTFEGSFPEGEELFRKENKYAYQREYRFKVSGAGDLNKPYIFNVGDLSQCTLLVPSYDLPTSLQVQCKSA